MKIEEISALCLIIAVVSFLGFMVENIWLSLVRGYMDNRNMCFPFLLGYGLAIVAIYLLFGTPANLVLLGRKIAIRRSVVKRLVYFLLIMLCVCLGELILGTLVEKVCHFYWWDYSALPLHITRYTSIPTSVGFATLIVTFMDYIFIPLFYRFLSWDAYILNITAGALMILMTGDFVYSAYQMYKNKMQVRRWKIDTTNTKLYRLLHS